MTSFISYVSKIFFILGLRDRLPAVPRWKRSQRPVGDDRGDGRRDEVGPVSTSKPVFPRNTKDFVSFYFH